MKKAITIVLSLIILLSACGQETYKTSASVIITNSFYSQNASTETSLTETYIEIFESYTALQKIIDNLDFEISKKQLKKSISFATIPDTQIIEIIVSYESREKANKILNCLLKQYPIILGDTFPTVVFRVISLPNDEKSSFTNKYGTETTKCAHGGCENYIAKSGDTNCCSTHSKRCLECNCYIDEDATYCMGCLRTALK